MKRLAFATAAVFLAVCAGLGAAELALQIADYPPSIFSPWVRDYDTGYAYAPELATRMVRPGEFDVAFRTNSLGMRDDEVGPKQGPRVLLLGDSFASGYGVERGQMFGDLLEERLGVEVVNAAVGGWEIVHQTRYFAARGRALQPDLVLYVLYLGNDLSRNDEWETAQDGALYSPAKDYPVRPAREVKLRWVFKQWSYMRRVRAEQGRGDWEPRDDYLLTAERELGEEARDDYARTETLLARLRDDVREAGAELFVALIPYRTMVDNRALEAMRHKTPDFDVRYDLDAPARRTKEMLERLGIEHADLSPLLESRLDATGEPLYFPVDGHLNVRGNEVVAQSLVDLLQPRVVLLD